MKLIDMLTCLRKWLPSFLFLLCFLPSLGLALSLPTVFSDHMVLQRGRTVPVWGDAVPGQSIMVEFAGQTVRTVADDAGKWHTELAALKASKQPRTLRVQAGEAALTFSDVLVGEVWLCSGQSNMQWSLSQSENGADRVAAAKHPLIRLFRTPRVVSEKPLERVDAAWQVCTPASARDFSAVAYYFGRKLQQDLDVPIGLLQSAWGGTRIEPWTPPSGFAGIPALAEIYKRVQLTLPHSESYQSKLSNYLEAHNEWARATRAAMAEETYVPAAPTFPKELVLSGSKQTPTKLYNSMIHAHVPYALRGAIWYQGEANRREGALYTKKTKALLQGWRDLWGYDFPFYFVQIAPYQYGDFPPEKLAEFWEAQADVVETIPHTGMTVISDVTDLTDIHPRNKAVPGARLALLAEANTYGIDVVSTGPVYEHLEVAADHLVVHFDAAAGLTTRDGKAPDWFEVAGEAGDFHQAKAQIVGQTVVLQSDAVPAPQAMRFAWHKLATPNLTNASGIPAASFRAGELPSPAAILAKKIPAAQGFRTVYQIAIESEANYGSRKVSYDVDRRAEIGAFSKIAYFLELLDKDGNRQHVFAAMDAFTQNIDQIGLPTAASGARFMQKVTGLTVRSNVVSVEACTQSSGGNIEFWPGNYGSDNTEQIPGARGDAYDFGDQPNERIPGYGSMQVHNWQAKQTVFAMNRWGGAGTIDVGIGNAPKGHPDWTFSKNGDRYETIRLTVLVKP